MAPTQHPALWSNHVIRAAKEHHTRVPLIQGVAIGLVVFAFIICTLRLAIRLKRRTTSYEDGFIAVAMWFWWAQVMYKLTIWPTKLSILFLYLRVFGDTPNVTSFGVNFRKSVYALMVFSAVFCVVTLIVNVLSCIPVHHYWDKNSSGRCGVDPFSWWLSQSLLNTISDIIILVLPMPLVKNLLQIPARQKLGLCLVFSLGGFVVIVTIMRISTFKTGGLGDDITYDGAVTLCWTIVETNVAIICACLPLLRPFIARMIPGFYGGSGMRSGNSYTMAQPTTTEDSPSRKPLSSHVPERMRPRSWVGIETVIGQGDGQTAAAGIHKQMEVDITTEAVSICGTESLLRLTCQDDEIRSEEARSSESSNERK
ncbi:hypothetical protein E4T50_15699 [Aureobasidium sp. EXF-12298]|nr:hypothetical protein E4T50_15699 [Aureobasidium sp. EXF-12298]